MIETSVVIPAKNAESTIGDCLEAVFDQHYPGGVEVIVIDSGSTDSTLAIVERFPVTLERITPEEFHHAKTRSYGAQMAKGKYIVYLNSDAIPCGRLWLEKLTANLEDPTMAGVSGRQIPRDDASPMESYWLDYFYDTKRRIISPPPGDKPLNVHNYDFFSTVNGAMRRDVLTELPFPDMVIMSEDKAWCAEALLAGYSVAYEPEAVVRHSHNFTLKQVFQHCFDSGMSYAQYCRHPSESSMFSYLRQGSDYFLHEMLFMIGNGHIAQIPYAMIYDSMKFLGRVLGKNYEHLPKSLVRKLCQHQQIYDGLAST